MTLEERVALLEQILTAQATPVGYYMSRYTGEETDNLLDKVATGEAGGGGVSSFNGRSGVVFPKSGDYTADMVGAPSMLDKGKAGGFPPLDNNTRIPMQYLYEEAVGQVGPPGKDFRVLGYFNTLSELELSVPVPKPGDSYGVGITAPYDIYTWDGIGKQWKNNGPLSAGNKIDKVYGATAGNLPTLTADGQLEDSGNTVSSIGVNRNILINPSLSVNQRGKTLYPSGTGYMFDGFRRGNPGIAERIGGAWKLTQGTAKGFIMCQRLESLPDGKYTASIRVASITGNWTLYFIAGKKDVKINAPGVYYVTGDVSGYSNDNYAVVLYSDSIGDTITFPNDGGSVIKLEHGERQTLAVERGGVVVPLEYPDYQTELLRCNRLFNKIYTNAYLNVSSLSGLYELMVQFPEMRVAPSISLTGSMSDGVLNIRTEQISKSSCLIRSNSTGSYVSSVELTAEL